MEELEDLVEAVAERRVRTPAKPGEGNQRRNAGPVVLQHGISCKTGRLKE